MTIDLNTVVFFRQVGEVDYSMPLSLFFAENEDCIDAGEQQEIIDALNTQGSYAGGGGAYPEWELVEQTPALVVAHEARFFSKWRAA